MADWEEAEQWNDDHDDKDDDVEDDVEVEDEDGELAWFFLWQEKMELKRVFFCFDFDLDEDWYEGGGVRGGRAVSEEGCLGVPGSDSHMNGTAPEAPP